MPADKMHIARDNMIQTPDIDTTPESGLLFNCLSKNMLSPLKQKCLFVPTDLIANTGSEKKNSSVPALHRIAEVKKLTPILDIPFLIKMKYPMPIAVIDVANSKR